MGRSMTFPRAGYPFEVYMLVLLPPLTAQIKKNLSQLHFGGGGKQNHSCIETYYALLSGTSPSNSAGAVSLEENS